MRMMRGDTIVEVMVAFAIFALVITSIGALMSQGMAMGQSSLETTLVREQVDAQAEMLRFVHAQDGVIWDELVERAVSSPMNTSDVLDSRCSAAPSGAFILHPDEESSAGVKWQSLAGTTYYHEPVTYSFVEDNGNSYGMWIQSVKAENLTGSSATVAYDFYIRACWFPSSGEMPLAVGTVVRLYEN